MPVIPEEALLLAPVVLAAYTAQTLSGFGASLIAVSLGAHYVEIDRLVPVLLPLTVLVTSTVAVQNRRSIDARLIVRRVLPFMGGGVLLGLGLYDALHSAAPKWFLGLIVTGFAGRQLWLHLSRRAHSRRLRLPEAAVFLIMAGVAQAFYTTGGPFITYVFVGERMSKAAFRATLCAVWSVFNIFLTIVFAAGGRINAGTLSTSLPLLLVLPLGLFLGERLHRRVNETLFRIGVCVLLMLSGLPLVFG